MMECNHDGPGILQQQKAHLNGRELSAWNDYLAPDDSQLNWSGNPQSAQPSPHGGSHVQSAQPFPLLYLFSLPWTVTPYELRRRRQADPVLNSSSLPLLPNTPGKLLDRFQ